MHVRMMDNKWMERRCWWDLILLTAFISYTPRIDTPSQDMNEERLLGPQINSSMFTLVSFS